jgi:hypothetical protein
MAPCTSTSRARGRRFCLIEIAITLTVIGVIAMLACGCAPARSDCMQPTAPAPLRAPADAALVVFVRHEGASATVYTVMDEQKQFVGQSVVRSRFAVTFPPGEHVFVAWDNRGPDANAFTFEVMGATSDAPDLPRIEPLQATLARGKVYLIEVGRSGTLRGASPDDGDAAVASTVAYTADVQRGQALLNETPMRIERIRKRAMEQLEGYRSGDVTLHTLHARDGR